MLIQEYSKERFYRDVTIVFGGPMEIIDEPIIINIRSPDHIWELMPIYQCFLIEYIEIKNIKRKDSLFNSKECLLEITIGQKRMGKFTLQLFHYNAKRDSYIYTLGIPIFIPSQIQYEISISGFNNNTIVILHGKRARPIS